VELAKKVAPFARGEVAAVNVAKSPLKVPNLAFEDASGKKLSLASFRGRTVLLNLWATWCVPCRKEMPTLDALEGALGSKDFQVVAVNIDTRDPDKPKRFLKDIGISKLAYYADPSAKAFQDLKAIGRAFGMPTTMLIDRQGCEIGTIAGPADWASPDAVKLIQAALGKR
jgi:thiol-disulfide isomerase/thioredoxin